MRKFIITLITIICFIFSIIVPKIAKANPWVGNSSFIKYYEESQDEEKITPMKTGDRAPYSGILFSVPAAARLKIEKETENERCQIKIDQQTGLNSAKYELSLSNEKAAKESAQKNLEEIRKIKDDQLLFMTKQLEKKEKRDKLKDDLLGLWITLGVLGGALTVLAGAYAIKQVGR